MSKKIIAINDGKPELFDLEEHHMGKDVDRMPLMKTVDLIHDGIDDMYDWGERGEEYHDYVVESYTHALSGISLLIDELEILAKKCPKMKEAYRQFKEAIR